STSSNGRERALPLPAGFMAYAKRTTRARPSGTRCSLRIIIDTISRKHTNVSFLATERYDVPLEERDDDVVQRAGRGYLVHQDLRTSGLGIDVPTGERLHGELEDRPSALVLIQVEAWINVVPGAARRMRLDTHPQTTFAFDESR